MDHHEMQAPQVENVQNAPSLEENHKENVAQTEGKKA